MKETTDIVVIGGGIAGCSSLYHLCLKGRTDAVLLERGELTEGSTWHAAGNIPTFSGSLALMQLQRYSADLYLKWSEEEGKSINYHRTGSIRLAHTEERMKEFLHVTDMAKAMGWEYKMLQPQEVKEYYPFMETHDIIGALWDPYDGDIDPSQITQAFASESRKMGAEIYRQCPATSIERDGDRWLVRTPKGSIRCNIIVNAAGYRTNDIANMVGVEHPVVSMEHQYLVTEDVPELVELGQQRLPLLRDPDISYYLRQERHGFILGPYERDCRTWATDGMPEDTAMLLFEDDLDRLDFYIEDACARVPLLATGGVQRVINGMIPYTPDGLPLIGEVYELENFYACAAFSFGVAQGGGAGKLLADIIVDGKSPDYDHWQFDPRRFSDFGSKHYAIESAMELYSREYDIFFPWEERFAGRPMRKSPTHERLTQLGAVFGQRGGWERACYFSETPLESYSELEPNERPKNNQTTQRPDWYHRVEKEYRMVRDNVGLMDIPGFSRFMVSGPDAEVFLRSLLCSRIPSVGRIGLGWVLDNDGCVVSEFTICCVEEGHYQLLSAAGAKTHDLQLLNRHAKQYSVKIKDTSTETGCVLITGPNAREALSRITDSALDSTSFPWLSAQTIGINDHEVWAMRLSYAGELGWELHVPLEHLASVYERALEAVTALGGAPFGMYAFDSLRMEKAYRGYKTDLFNEFTIVEAGFGGMVRKDGEFGGAQGLQENAHSTTELRCLTTIDTGAHIAANSPVYQGSEKVGITTSSAPCFNYNVIGVLAYIDMAKTPKEVEIVVDGERLASKVLDHCLYDPENKRLKA